MAQLIVYLNFNGNSREAMTFYKDCLGGELTMQTTGESPMADKIPPDNHNDIMHSSLVKDGLVIMASDMNKGNLVQGNTVHLMLNCKSEEEIRTLFAKLSAGGKIIQEPTDTFWGALYGELTDKFGIQWMFNYDKNQQ